MEPFLSYPLEVLKKERDKLEKETREKAKQGRKIDLIRLVDLVFAIKILEVLATERKKNHEQNPLIFQGHYPPPKRAGAGQSPAPA